MTDEEILPGPLKGLATAEEKQVYRYRRPSYHKIAFRRKVLQVENWIHKEGLKTKSEILAYIKLSFDMDDNQAKPIFKAVYDDFQRIGKVYG
jgi:hypothetical protein